MEAVDGSREKEEEEEEEEGADAGLISGGTVTTAPAPWSYTSHRLNSPRGVRAVRGVDVADPADGPGDGDGPPFVVEVDAGMVSFNKSKVLPCAPVYVHNAEL